MSSGVFLAGGFIYLNLASHMIAVLKNRLKDQGIALKKTSRILIDMIKEIFKESLVTTMLIPQEPCSVATMKTLFHRFAHCSIMKLQNSSMDKLLMLMITTLKKDVFLTSSPLQLYSLTMGNLSTLLGYSEDVNSMKLIELAKKNFHKQASTYTFLQYLEVKEQVLSMLETYMVKVINFVELGQQSDKGQLLFTLRNRHNLKPIPQDMKQNLKGTPFKEPENYLSYDNWQKWHNSLVVDYAVQYEQQSNRRKENNTIESIDRSFSKMFNLDKTKLEDFQIKLGLFQEEEEGTEKMQGKERKQLTKTEGKSESKTEKRGKPTVAAQIERQFAGLEGGEVEEQMDLLEMMDRG